MNPSDLCQIEDLPAPPLAEEEGRDADRRLRRLLRVLGGIDGLAIVAAVLPDAWMEALHRVCGLGDFPASPLVGYLTRSASLLYALHGAMLVFVSCDIQRYRPLIRFLAWTAVAHGALLVAVDLAEGMPLWWTLSEGPVYTIAGLAILRLSPGAAGVAAGGMSAKMTREDF